MRSISIYLKEYFFKTCNFYFCLLFVSRVHFLSTAEYPRIIYNKYFKDFQLL